MPCIPYRSPDGSFTAIVCTRGRRSKPCYVCGKPSSLLCDYKLTGKKTGKTCDRPLCARCAVSEPDGKGDTFDLCPAHVGQGQHIQEKLFP